MVAADAAASGGTAAAAANGATKSTLRWAAPCAGRTLGGARSTYSWGGA